MPTLIQIISGTKRDRDKLISPAEKWDQWDLMGLEKGTKQDWQMPKMVVNQVEVSYHLQVWKCTPSPLGSDTDKIMHCPDVFGDRISASWSPHAVIKTSVRARLTVANVIYLSSIWWKLQLCIYSIFPVLNSPPPHKRPPFFLSNHTFMPTLEWHFVTNLCHKY